MTWFPFEERREHRFRDEAVLSCYLGKVFHFCEARNVWGPKDGLFSGFLGGRGANRQNTYPGFEALSADLATAKEKVGEGRKKGSQWTISEVPVLLISGARRSVLVGEINTKEPLAEFPRLTRKRLSLEVFGQHFEPRRTNSVFRITWTAARLRPASLPFLLHHSRSYGGRYCFSWSAELSEQDIGGVLRFVNRITDRLHREEVKRI